VSAGSQCLGGWHAGGAQGGEQPDGADEQGGTVPVPRNSPLKGPLGVGPGGPPGGLIPGYDTAEGDDRVVRLGLP
jgi:hypothetical protein